MVEAAFVTHFPIPPIYPYLPFTPGYYILHVDIRLNVPRSVIGSTSESKEKQRDEKCQPCMA